MSEIRDLLNVNRTSRHISETLVLIFVAAGHILFLTPDSGSGLNNGMNPKDKMMTSNVDLLVVNSIDTPSMDATEVTLKRVNR